MKKINIYFTDFWPSFDCRNNFIYHMLAEFYEIEIVEDTPDYLFYSVFGYEYTKYDCVRIFYKGENVRLNFLMCDYAIGFDDIELNDRYIRYPHWRLYSRECSMALKRELRPVNNGNRKKFCNFIYSNGNVSTPRDEFFYKLSEYKKVDSGGKHLNNIGESVKDKIAWCSQYKFSIAFENSSTPGYATEKLLQAFAANTVPIYFGDPRIVEDFNSRAFINCHEYGNFDEVIRRIEELDSDDKKYMEILEEPAINEGVVESMDEEFEKFLKNIFSQSPKQALRRSQTVSKKVQEKTDKIIVYGIGNSYEEFKNEIEKKFEIVAVTSSYSGEKERYSNYIGNTEFDKIKYDYVLVFSNYEVDIVNMLVKKMGIPHNKILLKDMVFNPKGICYSLYSEDAIIYLLLNRMGVDYVEVSEFTYLELGTKHPIRFNFTYSLYLAGAGGVLAKTEHSMENMIKIARPRDFFVSHVIDDEMDSGADAIDVCLEKIGCIPDILSVYTEGNGLEVLRQIDYGKIRPIIIVVGFGQWGSAQNGEKEITHLLQEKGYLLEVNNGTNGVFMNGDMKRHRQDSV